MALNSTRVIGVGLAVILAGVVFFPPIFQNTDGRKEDTAIEKLALTDTSKTPQSGDKPTYVTTKRRPKNVILMIGDGMGLTQLSAGIIAARDALAIEEFRHIGLVKTFSTKLITDSAAGATAMATGQKTYNGAIAVSVDQKPLKTILEYAEEAQWVTGIVTTTTVTHATPACFYGHQSTRAKVNLPLAVECLEQDMEVVAGGGKGYFADRSDGINLWSRAQERGYFVVDSMGQIGADYTPKRFLCLISPELPGRLSERGDFLPQATKTALRVLDAHRAKGFFLMVEGGQIDWGGHDNDSQYIIEEMLDFDRAVAQALAFAKKDGETLLVVTADHETGGYAIDGGDMKTKEIKGSFTTKYHTAALVPAFAYGPGAESFTGFFDNTEIFFKLRYLMDLE